MATQLYDSGGDAVTVRAPNVNMKNDVLKVGSSRRMLNGSLSQRVLSTKDAWDVEWAALTDAEQSTIMDELRTAGELTWSPPDEAGTYTVLVVGDPQREKNGRTYSIRCRLEEV